MLELINRYAHGYVAIPVILACKEKGFFQLLKKDGPQTLNHLVQGLGANEGYLQVALRMLQSLQWVSYRNKAYSLEEKSESQREIPKEILELYHVPMDSYLTESKQRRRLRKWIDHSRQRWKASDPLIADFLDGVLVLPLLIALKRHALLEGLDEKDGLLFSKLSPSIRKEVLRLFQSHGWAMEEGARIALTDAGRFMVDRIFITGTIVCYRQMLQKVDELIFGDPRQIFERDKFGQERHLERALNAVASGFQHEKYFKDIDKIVLSIFNRRPWAEQPKYVADMGCGDGTLLKRIYTVIRDRSERGKVLDQFPVKMIAVDYNECALKEALKTVTEAKIPFEAVQGDIGNPQQMIADLKAAGIEDLENILHVRSFLDHDRPFIAPTDKNAVARRRRFGHQGVYVDEEGKAIEPARMVQGLVEHLRRWSSMISNHGLILLEVNSVDDPELISRYLAKSENLHFDAYHAFSRQYLVEADVFLMAAAEVGLFAKCGFSKKYPMDLAYSRVTLNHFERRDYRVRYAEKSDFPALKQLEVECWPAGLRTPSSILRKRLSQYPEGQLVLEIKNEVVGVIYSQRIAKIEDVRTVTNMTVDTLHQKEGRTVQLLSLNILPKFQQRSLGDQLLEFMLLGCSLMGGVDAVVGVTLCKAYHTQHEKSLKDYIHERNAQGKLVDPVLRFHEIHGACIERLVPGYRPKDKKNEGCGVLVSYDIHHRTRDEVQIGDSGKNEELQTRHQAMSRDVFLKAIEDFLETVIKTCLGQDNEAAFTKKRPLMEMGLDSADLLTLNEQIRDHYQIELAPAFFFQYNTTERILSYLKEQLVPHEKVLAGKPRSTANPMPQTLEPEKGFAGEKLNDPLKVLKGVAIVGMACRLPGGITTPEEFWEMLRTGKNVIRDLPKGRWVWPAEIDPVEQYPGIKRGGFLESIDCFDATLFRLSPREAELMDPQQRILLELSWEVLEDAGYSSDSTSNTNTGVFIGASGSDFRLLLEQCRVGVEAYFETGNSMSVLANRISYFYDFHGPSLQIDTACSSSLVAMHKAVQSLQSGECSQALVGGVNVICHPATSIAYYKAGMLSSDGQCKTFDKRADGYVRAEGAVMLLLKPLNKAVSDNDTIHAVIKGTACNHGGQASGLTVPNPEHQAKLVQEAWKTAKIAPETIGYIEAHGTGTSLGDPIEVSGLKTAFSQVSCSLNHVYKCTCGLGSVKTNLGHLEAAAGLAGLLKVVMSLKNRELPASLNFKKLNPRIDIRNGPFFIVDQHQNWLLPEDQALRRAGVSSFGSGGANAHAVLEEYVDVPAVPIILSRPLCFLLSATSEERLQAYAQKLLSFLNTKKEDDLFLASLVYTFLTRQAMNERVVLIVNSLSELKEKLAHLGEGREMIEGTYRGCIKDGHGIAQLILSNPDIRQVIDNWVLLGATRKIAELWVKGVPVNWELFYQDSDSSGLLPRRIHVPTYPFARERYWVEVEGTEAQSHKGARKSNVLHPLVHENTSNFGEQRFTSTFTGDEFFLPDHVIEGKKVLPGVTYLEMARAAIEQAIGVQVGINTPEIQLKNIVWAQPLTVGDKTAQVHIRLFPEANGQIRYEIYTEANEPVGRKFDIRNCHRVAPSDGESPLTLFGSKSEINSNAQNTRIGSYIADDLSWEEHVEEEVIVHSQGIATLTASNKCLPLDLTNLQTTINQLYLSPERFYNAYKTMGIHYGSGHQSLEAVYVGKNLVLAKLSLPSSVLETQDQYILHPSLIDSALHASIGLFSKSRTDTISSAYSRQPLAFPSLPLALQELHITGKCAASMWALIRFSKDSKLEDSAVAFEIDLFDEKGAILVRMRALSYQAVSQPSITQHSLHSLSEGGSNYSGRYEKPSKISLRSLSEDQILSNKLEGRSEPSITLSATNIPTSQALVNDESKAVAHIQASISVESLQEELINSFAAILYLKRSDSHMVG